MGVGRHVLACSVLSLALAGCSESAPVAPPGAPSTPTAVTSSPPSSHSASGGPAPSSDAVPTRAASLTPTHGGPAVKKVSKPPPAHVRSPEGAVAFIGFYVEQLNRAWSKPDPSVLQGLATASCKSCANFAATASRLQAKRQRYEGAAVSLGPSVVLPESTTTVVSVQAALIQEARRVLGADGSSMRSVSRKPSLTTIQVRWSPEGWQIAGMHVEPNA